MEQSYVKAIQQQQQKLSELSAIYTQSLQAGLSSFFLRSIVEERIGQQKVLEAYQQKLERTLHHLYT